MPFAIPSYGCFSRDVQELLSFKSSARGGVLPVMVMALICLNLSMLSLGQGASKNERESLRGLQGVQVVIEDIDQDARAEGLSKERIRTAVERVLTSSGIRILEEQDRTASRAWLHVQTGTLKELSGRYAYMIRVYLRQKVFVESSSHSMSAATWESGIVLGTVRGSNLRQVVATVEEKTKEFANDFLAQNSQ